MVRDGQGRDVDASLFLCVFWLLWNAMPLRDEQDFHGMD